MKKLIWIANSVFFVVILFCGGITFWMLPKQVVSTDENRELKKLPIVNMDSVLSGKFEKSFEEYYNDHFPFRDRWLDISSFLNGIKGSSSQEIRVVNLGANSSLELESEENLENIESSHLSNEGQEATAIYPKMEEHATSSLVENKAISSNILADQKEQLTSQIGDKDYPDEKNVSTITNDNEFSKIRGVIITNGRVLQIFAGSKKTIKNYTNMLNQVRNRLPNNAVMYSMIVPSGSDFYLPSQINKGILKEKENLNIAAQLLSPQIIDIPAYDELSPHKNEYIYFRTDHHWTGLGAYYAYRAFARYANFQPLELENLEFIRKNKTFLGSLYKYTKDPKLKKSADILEYYKVPAISSVRIYSHKNLKDSFNSSLYIEKNNSYLLFLQGDFPLVHINTPMSGTRKILIVKDSFANAFIPYLSMHYGDIYVVDYRYFKGNIFDLMKQHSITELLYIHNTFAANSQAAVKFGYSMLK